MVRKSCGAALSLLLVLSIGCKSDDKPQLIDPGMGPQVLVGCEGSLGNGNAALTLYKPQDKLLVEDVYKANNNGQQLGDVLESITELNGQLYLCINNSDKVVVLDENRFTQTGLINVDKPRQLLKISNTKAYVSSLFNNKLYSFNPSTNTLTDTITLPYKNLEGMLQTTTSTYVAMWDTANSQLYRINVLTDELSVFANLNTSAPQVVKEDRDGNIWVLSGNVYKQKNAALTKLNPVSGQILEQFPFATGVDVVRLEMNENRDTLYFIEVDYNGGTNNNGVFRMSIRSSSLPTIAFVAGRPLQYYWGVGIQPGTGNVFVANPKGFTQRGEVSVYNPSGDSLYSFSTGVGPGHFYFKK